MNLTVQINAMAGGLSCLSWLSSVCRICELGKKQQQLYNGSSYEHTGTGITVPYRYVRTVCSCSYGTLRTEYVRRVVLPASSSAGGVGVRRRTSAATYVRYKLRQYRSVQYGTGTYCTCMHIIIIIIINSDVLTT